MNTTFPEKWIGFGLGALRPVGGTYGWFDLAACPKVPDLPQDFAWLPELPDELDAGGMIVEHQSLEEFDSLLRNLKSSSPDGVPPSFWLFLASQKARESLVSPTDCHFELSPSWIKLPSLPQDRYVRFMSDSQYCVSWYLRVHADRAASVVACGCLGTDDIEFESPLIEDAPFDEQPNVELHILQSLVTVAHSFPEFIYRVWIEGLIWFRVHQEMPFTPSEREYAGQLQSTSMTVPAEQGRADPHRTTKKWWQFWRR